MMLHSSSLIVCNMYPTVALKCSLLEVWEKVLLYATNKETAMDITATVPTP